MNRVVHFEIYTDDPKAVQPFYQDVFGWRFQKFEGGPMEYWLVATGDDKQPGINGGLTRPREGQNPGTLNTIGVTSLDASIKKLSRAAAKSACRRWQFLMSAGLPTRQILPATSLELSSPIPTRSSEDRISKKTSGRRNRESVQRLLTLDQTGEYLTRK